MIAVIETGSSREAVEYAGDILKNGVLGGIPVDEIYVREKSLSGAEYLDLARRIKKIIDDNGYSVKILVRYMPEIDTREFNNLHLSHDELNISLFENAGVFKTVSAHSVREALDLEPKADRFITGHIFATDCKSAPPKGLEYLKAFVSAVKLPVAAIGGITEENYQSVIDAGASDVAVMNSWRKPKENRY